MATPKQTDPQFKLRLPGALKNDIENASKTNNRSMNAEIVARLEESFQAHRTADGQAKAIARLTDTVESLRRDLEKAIVERWFEPPADE